MEEKKILWERAQSLQLSLDKLDASIELKSNERNEMIGLVTSTESIAIPMLRSFDEYVYGMTFEIEEARQKREKYAHQLEELTLKLA